MPSTLPKYHRTQKGKIVYDRPFHAWSEDDLQRVAEKLMNQPERDEPAILGIFYRITQTLLAEILKLVRLEVYAPAILRWLVDRANELLELVGFHITLERQQTEAQEILVRFTPYCEPDWLVNYAKYLKNTYSV